MQKLPNRRSVRLGIHGYAVGTYFITICCENHCSYFGAVVEDEVVLTDAGQIVKEEWEHTFQLRERDMALLAYVVMPNHFHALLCLGNNDGNNGIVNPFAHGFMYSTRSFASAKENLSTLVRGFKGAVTRRLGFSPWQRGFFDHVVRDERDYENIHNYIAENPRRWPHDRYYTQ